ncbi:class I SAM-dependent methyltransferase [Cedecea davisae]|uniref:Class I SAM-dependent methyltransferase n=1 Tax=Cedecea davisae TaxID=158484 RepID=A0ABS6DJT1_9ENTR|nr:class I SAM-dependent methyltransferase [Cedecea davisae]MBU4683481.1 class I SAM-dependent methyltransferase [Cedecea davisae]MBU4685231.1 class I SAM-dependent methyltransferase [Cedecea davisae]
MPDTYTKHADLLEHNRTAWDTLARQQAEWSQPVSPEIIARARRGEWQIHLTPGKLPADWLPDVQGKRILCLASAGGQQAPVLAAAGAEVTVFDLSRGQLEKDRYVAERDGLTLTLIEGDMCDLSAFGAESFDYIIHPISNQYVPDIRPVWQGCYRILASGGKLLSSFFNPVVFIGDRAAEYAEQGIIRPRFSLPYSDIKDLQADELAAKQKRGEALIFGHSLNQQIGGQLAAGFRLCGFYEDQQPNPRFLIERYMPTFIATCAIK